MGKRRIRCLRALGEHDIVAFDALDARRAEAEKLYGIKTVPSFTTGLESGVDTVLVSTPPDAHYEFVRAALNAKKHCFCEANIVTEGAAEFGELALRNAVVAAPSATFKFHPIYQTLHRWVIDEGRIGKPLLLHFHMGNYILDWHPWEGLNFYAGKKSTGACREMVPFEFVWMQWIFGAVEEVQCMCSKQLDLPTDIDDAYAILVRFRSGLLATILIEVVDRDAVRQGRLISQTGTITWDFASPRLRHYDANARIFQEQKVTEKKFDIEEVYVAEVAAFLKACRGEERWSHSYSEDQQLSRILLACERSSSSGQRIRVEDVA